MTRHPSTFRRSCRGQPAEPSSTDLLAGDHGRFMLWARPSYLDGDRPGDQAFSVPTGQFTVPGVASSMTQWPNIHAALQRLTGTPDLESLRAALTPLETRHRRGRNRPCPPLHHLCNPNGYGFEAPMPLNTVADVRLSGWTLLSSTAALAAPRRRGFSWYAPQTEYPSTFLPASARLVRTSVSPASFGRNYRLVYLLTTLALSTEPTSSSAWRDGFRHPRRDLSLHRSVCTTGHRDYQEKQEATCLCLPLPPHAATVHCTQRRRAIPSLNAQVLHPSKQDICPADPALCVASGLPL